MTSEPNTGSIDAVADAIMSTPATQENLDEVVEAIVEEPQGVETDAIEEPTENLDVVDHNNDEETEDLNVVENEFEDDTAAPIELSDDYEIEYKADGEIKRATLGELKRSAAGQDYIQKGMEDNAKVRKELELVNQNLLSEREKLGQLVSQIENGTAPSKPIMPSKELQQSDPFGYLEQMEEYRQQTEEYNKFLEVAKNEETELAKQRQVAKANYIKEQGEILKKEIPELGDPEKSEKLMKDIHQISTEYYGVPQEVLKSLVHSWEFRILKDAVAYQKLRKSKTIVAEKTKDARPVVKAGAKQTASGNKVKRREAARTNMRKSGSHDDVAKFLLS